jgi:hypothetical protein
VSRRLAADLRRKLAESGGSFTPVELALLAELSRRVETVEPATESPNENRRTMTTEPTAEQARRDALRASFESKSAQLADVISRSDANGTIKPPAADPPPAAGNGATPPPPPPRLGQGPRQSTEMPARSLAERIADAEQAGNWALVHRLKAERLYTLAAEQQALDA